MADARSEILARIRAAGAGAPVAVPRDYHGAGQWTVADPVALFAERVRDYRATVRRCPAEQVAAVLAELTGAGRFVVAPGFPDGWRPPGAVEDDPPLPVAELDAVDGVLTTCAVAIAATGTIVLDAGPGQGRRAITLVPDRHVVVVRAEQVVPAVPDAVAALAATRPQTWISGPSATSDIELDRVEGVHGPRLLEVVLVG